jgi:putative sigma-54 modulation protein
MNIYFQAVDFDADQKLVAYAKEKVAKLSQFYDRITHVTVLMKLGNVSHSIQDKIVDIKVHIPGHNFFVNSVSKKFERSFDVSLASIINQIKSRKEKRRDKKRRMAA